MDKLIIYFKIFPLIAPAAIALTTINSAQAATFNFITDANAPQNLIEAFNSAGDLWSQHLHDDVTINIEIGLETLPEDMLGGARPDMVRVDYNDVLTQLGLDQTSTDDNLAVNNLSLLPGGQLSRLINETTINRGKKHLDNTMTDIWMSRANAKALGIIEGNNSTVDGQIFISNSMLWDLDSSNGMDTDSFDLVGTVAHEIGHVLGFLSGVDILDYQKQINTPQNDLDYNFVSTMDLFRQSQTSYNSKAMFDWRVSGEDTYFSLDGGATKIASFAQGESIDNNQTSHWKDNNNLGVMDPSLAPEEIKQISTLDLQLLNAIGWDLQSGSNVDYQTSSASYTLAEDIVDIALTWGRGSSGSTGHSFRQLAFWQSSDAAKVPEPTTALSLLGLGLFGSLSFRKKRF